jgi:hypothetical protein
MGKTPGRPGCHHDLFLDLEGARRERERVWPEKLGVLALGGVGRGFRTRGRLGNFNFDLARIARRLLHLKLLKKNFFFLVAFALH